MPLTVKDWQLNDFLNLANYQQLEKQVDEWWQFDDVSSAWQLYRQLKKKEELWANLKERSLVEKYQALVRRLAYLSLPFLEDYEVEGLFEKEIAQALSYADDEYNLWAKLRAKLMLLPLAQRDEYKIKLAKLLEKNDELLTTTGLFKGESEVDGTIKNWLADFRYFLAEQQVDDKLARAEYLYKAKNIIRLAKDERAKIQRLIKLYNQLHKSSRTLEGIEDPLVINDKGELYLLDQGRIVRLNSSLTNSQHPAVEEPAEKRDSSSTFKEGSPQVKLPKAFSSVDKQGDRIKKPVKQNKAVSADDEANRLTVLQQIYRSFLQTSLMQAVDRIMEKILSSNEKDFKILRGYFYRAVNHKQVEQAIAALLAIAKLGKIRQAFGEDERFVDFWSKYLSAKNLDAESFKKDPARAEFLARFFKYILEERLGIGAKQAVLLGMLLANLCRQAGELEYQSIAYGDPQTGEFKWNI